ncbi:MAG: AAA family ATPase [Myxococcales bacterium]|nr:AAA family ATPase [Myxococcales bacterium]
MTEEPEIGLRFYGSAEGASFRPTQCWIQRTAEANSDEWTLHLSQPDGDAMLVDDLKQWVLFDNDEYRHLESDDGTFVRVHCDAVLERYLRTVRALAPNDSDPPLWCLMPSLSTPKQRRRYRDVISRALPRARILQEPEMVLEYFRLVRRELFLTKSHSSIFLVVDAGASTCNLTFVISRKDKKIVNSITGISRKSALSAKQGTASKYAGRWVDEEIARLAGFTQQLRDLPMSVRQSALRNIELAKIEVASNGTPINVRHPSLGAFQLTTSLLEEVSRRLWDRILPVYRDIEDALATDTDDDTVRHLLQSGQASKAISGIILAGGTSRLPGFEREMMMRVFNDASAQTRVHRVHGDYRTVAAQGALAHVLHQHYKPRRLQTKELPENQDTQLASHELQAAPLSDIFISWSTGADNSQQIMVLDRDDEGARQSGTWPIKGLPTFLAQSTIRARLLPDDSYSKQGLKPQSVVVKRAPGRMSLAWNSVLQEARVESDEVDGVNKVVLRLAQLEQLEQPKRPRVPERMHLEGLWTDGAPDIVVDFGMSKTVIIQALPGRFTAPVSEREPAPEVVSAALSASLLRDDYKVADDRRESIDASGMISDIGTDSAVATFDQSRSISNTRPRPERTSTTNREHDFAKLGEFLEKVMQPTMEQQPLIAADLTMLMLALAVRPFVLLAGPPGSGKSTLARKAANLLGLRNNESFFEVTVQPHWRTKSAIPVSVRSIWEHSSSATGDLTTDSLHMFLFDEFNLARPENYLMPFFRILDKQKGRIGPFIACGTLNIDDSSRPPSPKIIDRCLLVEIDAPRERMSFDGQWLQDNEESSTFRPINLPQHNGRGSEHHIVTKVITLIRNTVKENQLRQDLLPSHRDEQDLYSLVGAYREGRIPTGLLSEDDLVDRAIAGRLLVKVGGAAAQVEPLVQALQNFFQSNRMPRCQRRMSLATSQMTLGFVSPWH